MSYEIACTDVVGRDRTVVVEVRDGHIAVAGPPGDGFTLSARQAVIFGDVVRLAAHNATPGE